MIISSQLTQAVTVCSGILHRHHDRGLTVASRDLMVAEVETLVGWLRETHLSREVWHQALLAPVQADLRARHGEAVGEQLFAELVAVMDAAEVAAEHASAWIHPDDGRKAIASVGGIPADDCNRTNA